MNDELVKVESQPLALRHELSVEEVLARIHKVHQTMDKAMVDGHHYGKIPGTDKPTLLKPGAELLNVMFRLDPQYETADRVEEGGHLTVTSTCTLWHIPTGQRWGSGQGSCSTHESKYAYRQAQRICPACGKAAIIKGKAEYGGGWLCFKKRDGCGAKYKEGDAAIEAQETGRIANPDLPDTWNTVRKMANKRSLVAAVLNVTAASDIFTQDLEDAVAVDHPVAATVRVIEPETPAEELFKTPLEEEAEQKQILLGRIGAGMDLLKMAAPERTEAWEKDCPGTAFMSMDPTLAQLKALRETLVAKHKAKK
jgi:hypothetical protein